MRFYLAFEDINAEHLKVRYLEPVKTNRLRWIIQKTVKMVCSLCTYMRPS
jgi:hypothetical protein